MKKQLLLFVVLAIPVLLIAETRNAAGTTGPKIVFEPEQKKVRFVDEKGRAFKELSLAEEKTKIKINDADGARVIKKTATVSTNKKFAAVVKNRYTYAITPEQLQQLQGRGGEAVGLSDFITEMRGTVALYEAFGNVVFEQSVPEGTVVWPRPVVSDNGTVALITEGRLDDPQRDDKLLVYDHIGKELLVYPRPGERSLVPLDISKLSSHGRYLAVRVDFGHREGSKTVFFDLIKSATRKADQAYVVYDITDGGLVTADYFNRETREIIPVKIHLKNFLGGE